MPAWEFKNRMLENKLITTGLPPLQSIYPKSEASTMPVCVGCPQTPIYKKEKKKLLDKKSGQKNSLLNTKLTSTCKDGRWLLWWCHAASLGGLVVRWPAAAHRRWPAPIPRDECTSWSTQTGPAGTSRTRSQRDAWRPCPAWSFPARVSQREMGFQFHTAQDSEGIST